MALHFYSGTLHFYSEFKCTACPMRPQGMLASHIRLIHRRPDALTKWLLLERAPSRYIPLAMMRLPRLRSIVSSMLNRTPSAHHLVQDVGPRVAAEPC